MFIRAVWLTARFLFVLNQWQVHAQGLGYNETEMGAACPQITFQNTPYNILPGSARLKNTQEIGGLTMDSDFVFTLLVSTFGATATPDGIKSQLLNTRITYLGHDYKVETVSEMAGGLQLHIEANDWNQRA